MSLFPRLPQGDFAPLFRFIDDYDTHRSSSGGNSSASQSLRSFQPRFDVREEKDNYLLNGELPGIEQKDVDISFIDDSTVVIKGRTDRHYESGTPPAIEGPSEQGKITEGGEHQYHKATVEEEGGEGQKSNGASTEVTKSEKQRPKKHEQKHKYWVSERNIGEFHRSFTFPGRVDQDAVKASLKNGILSVVVPKAVPKEARKIRIE